MWPTSNAFVNVNWWSIKSKRHIEPALWAIIVGERKGTSREKIGLCHQWSHEGSEAKIPFIHCIKLKNLLLYNSFLLVHAFRVFILRFIYSAKDNDMYLPGSQIKDNRFFQSYFFWRSMCNHNKSFQNNAKDSQH